MYKLTLDPNIVKRPAGEGAYFLQVTNPEYQEWLGQGNQPEPAETDQEKQYRLLAELKTERNRLLAESDPMVLPDFPGGSTQALLAYRQALRDFPVQFPSLASLEALADADWPVRPF